MAARDTGGSTWTELFRVTELIWEGKYDAQGRKVAPPRIALPFQTVEKVNESGLRIVLGN
jgi:hypothetical protein